MITKKQILHVLKSSASLEDTAAERVYDVLFGPMGLMRMAPHGKKKVTIEGLGTLELTERLTITTGQGTITIGFSGNVDPDTSNEGTWGFGPSTIRKVNDRGDKTPPIKKLPIKSPKGGGGLPGGGVGR